jgi:hypothetical protein
MTNAARRRGVVAAVRKAAGDEVDDYELSVVRDHDHPELWHVWRDLGAIVEVGGPVWTVHAPTGLVFEQSGSTPPGMRVIEVLDQLANGSPDA